MINPAHIRTFLKLSETCHFTQTADALNMTQPGVSQHLQALERELKASLFHRFGQKMELSSAGEMFQKYALRQAESESRLRENLNVDSSFEGACSVTCSGSMATQLYPRLLELQKQHKNLHMSVEAAPNATSIRLVKENECDIGLITCLVDDPEIQVTEFGHESLCLALPSGRFPEWSDLMDLGYIDHPNGAHYAVHVLGQNFKNDFTGFKNIPISGYINQLSQILLPVAQGLGFTILPESTVDQFPEANLIEKAPLYTLCQETLYLITKKYKPLPNRYRLLEDCLKEIFQKPKNLEFLTKQ